MAGAGKRMRPHTLTVPKPLIPVAGKPIVQWLCEELMQLCGKDVTDIAFVVGNFGKEAEQNLIHVAEKLGARGHICYQQEALGTAHAILCAKEFLDGDVIIAFADTLFYADFKIDNSKDGIIWVKTIEDPSQFGVVKLQGTVISEFVEKPKDPVSNMAIIGIYYFKDGVRLRNELQYLIDNDIKLKGEYQITDALENMKNKGAQFGVGSVDSWLDCGNKDATVSTAGAVLHHYAHTFAIPQSARIINSTIIQPCYIGENVVIEHSVIGPNVSIGTNSVITKSVIENAIIQNNTGIQCRVIDNAMIGSNVVLKSHAEDLSIGDFVTQSR